jgi:hypothetical protein
MRRLSRTADRNVSHADNTGFRIATRLQKIPVIQFIPQKSDESVQQGKRKENYSQKNHQADILKDAGNVLSNEYIKF